LPAVTYSRPPATSASSGGFARFHTTVASSVYAPNTFAMWAITASEVSTSASAFAATATTRPRSRLAVIRVGPHPAVPIPVSVQLI